MGRIRISLCLTTVLALGCGSDPSDPVDASVAGHDASSEADEGGLEQVDSGVREPALGPDVPVGGFAVQLVGPNAETQTPGFTSFVGKVYDGPAVEAIVWEPQVEREGCRLFTPRVPFCEAPCGSAVCVEENTCQPYPMVLSLGTLIIQGLRSGAGQAQAIEAIENNGSYQLPGGTNLLYPAFEEGETIRVEAGGAAVVEAFTLEAKGVAPLELTEEGAYPLEAGKAFDVRWTPKGTLGDSRVHLHLDISHHGGSKGKIECDVDDDGSLAIPAELVDQLMQLGVAGFPSVLLTRRSAVSVRTSVGNVELAILSRVERPVEIPGLISCSHGGDPCPDGKTCQADLTCS